MDAAPSELVRDVEALNDPDDVLQTTVASETLRPCASVTLIVKGSGNLVPTSGDTWASPATRTALAGDPIRGPDASAHAVS
jgi:hypothetical protein